MDARHLLNTLLDEISEDEKSVAEKRKVAAFLRTRIERGEAVDRATPALPAEFPMTLAERVREAVDSLPETDFSVHDVRNAFTALRLAMPAHPMSKLSTELAKLFEAEALERTLVGGGSIPHRYRRAPGWSKMKERDEALA